MSWFSRWRAPFQGYVPPYAHVFVYPSESYNSAPPVRDWRGRFIDTIGSTTAGIQEAINHVLEYCGGGVVELGVGTYTLTTALDFYTGSATLSGFWNPATAIGLTIKGAGKTASLLQRAGNIANFDWSKYGSGFDGTAKLTIEGVGFQYIGTSDASTSSLLRIEAASANCCLKSLGFNARHNLAGGGNVTYDLLAALEIDDSWEIYAEDLYFQNLNQGIEIDCPTRNGGNMTFVRTQMQNVKLGVHVRGVSTTNSIKFDDIKCVSGGANDDWPDHLTFDLSGATAGQKATYEDGSTAVYIGTGIAPSTGTDVPVGGLTAYIGHGNLGEVKRVTNYDSGTGLLTLAAALEYDYTADSATSVEVIYGGRIGFVIGFRSPQVEIVNGHFEGTAPGIFWGGGVTLKNQFTTDAGMSNALGQGEEYGVFAVGKVSHELRLEGGMYKSNNRTDGFLGKAVNDWDPSNNVGGPIVCEGVQGYTTGGNETTRELDEVFTFGSANTRRFGRGDRELHFNRTVVDFSPTADAVTFSGKVKAAGSTRTPITITGDQALDAATHGLVFADPTSLTANVTITLPASPDDGQDYEIVDISNDGTFFGTYGIIVQSATKNINGAATKTIKSGYGKLSVVWSTTADEWVILDSIGTIT